MQTNKFDYPRNDNHGFASTNHLSICRTANIILRISVLLFESGAHCERINRNIQRIAQKTGYDVDLLISFTAISISVVDKENSLNTITANRKIKHHSTHYGMLTNTSLLTWDFFDEKINLNQLETQIEDLQAMPRYSVWIVRLFIGIACGCLCLLAGGDLIDGTFAFVASFFGLWARQAMIAKNFNLMVAVACSAFATTTISSINVLYGLGKFPESSVATAVLFLIPGVPLINSIIDLLEGYIPTGLARGAFGGFILLSIAIGMFLSMTLIGLNYY